MYVWFKKKMRRNHKIRTSRFVSADILCPTSTEPGGQLQLANDEASEKSAGTQTRMPFHLQRVGHKREAQLQWVWWMTEKCMIGKNIVNRIIPSQTTKFITLLCLILAKTAELWAWTKRAVRLYIILATQTRIQSHSYLLSAVFDGIAIR